MSILRVRRSIRNIRRYREIIAVLLKYGFADIIDQLKVDLIIQRLRLRSLKRDWSRFKHRSRPERICLALEELGPTFIKLGQMLSTRFDLIPFEYITALRKLQDNVTPFPVDQCIVIIEKEVGEKVDTLFSEFEREPIAAASIAQVHRAHTKKGEDVVLKVRRPDIQEVINTDIHILKDLAKLIEKHIPESLVFDPTGLVEQFQSWICDELNFFQEARNIYRFRQYFAEDETVYIPKIFWEMTTDKVLTMEYIDGIPIDHLDQLTSEGMDPARIARNGTLFVLRQIFEFHFFHGDPHPGNLFVLPGHVIVPLDYGLMGRMDKVLVGQVGDLLRGMVTNDTSLIVRTLIHLNQSKTDIERDHLRIDVSDLLARYHAVPLHMLRFEYFFNDLVKLIRKNRIRFPRSLYLMGKSLILMEGVAQKLNPEFDIISIAQSFFSKTMVGRAEAEKLINNVSQITEDYMDLIVSAPNTLHQILNKLRWGKMEIRLNHQRIDDFVQSLDRSANRLSFSIIIAALIVGSSLIIQLNKGPLLWEIPVLGLAGFSLAGVLGLWLIFSMIRSGKL